MGLPKNGNIALETPANSSFTNPVKEEFAGGFVVD